MNGLLCSLMEMPRRWFTHAMENRLSIALVLMAVAIFSSLLLTPYIVNDPYFEVGFDTGVYERVIGIYHGASEWRDRLPAYPYTEDYDTEWMDKMEPGFPVHLSLAYIFSDMPVRNLFRWVLPVIVATIMVLVVFVIASRITESEVGGGIAAVLVAGMNLQLEIVNESLYKQLFCVMIVLAMLYGLDRLLYSKDDRYLIPTILMAGGTYYYHYATAFTAFLFLGVVLVVTILFKKRWMAKKMVIVIGAGLLTIMPSFIPRIGENIPTIMNALTGSIERAEMLGTDAGTLFGGGAIPNVLSSFQHILVGYFIVFFPFVLAGGIAIVYLLRRKSPTFILWMALFQAFYIGMWLYFGNRMIYEFDILMGILTGVTLFFIARWGWEARKKATRYCAIALVAVFIVGVVTSGFVYQSDKEPYIVDNIEGVRWIEENIPVENSVIFAPDYLSANLIQLGYRMAIWDYSIPTDGSHPIDDAEAFMLYAPSNSSFTEAFFNEHPNLIGLNLIVIWGEWDLDRPLVSSKKLIPIDKYETADNFILEYHGHSEILSIYKYVDNSPH